MARKPPIDESKLPQNPFSFNLQIPVNEGEDHREYVDNGEGTKKPKPYWVERTPFVKQFLVKGAKERTMLLSDRGIRLFEYIKYQLEAGKDYVYLDPAIYKQEAHVKSTTTFVLAKEELCRYNFICPTPFRRYYWINPEIIFNGNRPKKYPFALDVRYHM